MKKRNTLAAIVFVAIIHVSNAQFAQLELASGPKKTDLTSISFTRLSSNGKFSVGTLAFFQEYHQEEYEMFDEVGVQSTIYWNMNKSFSIGHGLYYNSISGFTRRLSILYAIRSEYFVLNAIPTVAHSEETNFTNGELFLQMQWTRPIKENWKLLLSAQILTHWEQFADHTRSFEQVRVGFDRRATQFGLAIDYDQYGASPTTITSLGVFVRKIFLSN